MDGLKAIVSAVLMQGALALCPVAQAQETVEAQSPGPTLAALALPVESLAQATEFYTSIFGLVVKHSFDNTSMTENILGTEGGEGAALVLVQYKDKQADKSESVRVVFHATDPAALLAAGQEKGATVVLPARDIPELGATLGIMRDPEGYLVEVIKRAGTPPAARQQRK
ncbi:VOC family protein [Parahaliea aestuarii]|uniref:VOC family protein n=1 Tax=Parahaliea aestuarii TaxID=1852021 RepID=A0A5C9A680_9GAMM|nr:VOC family protein [Parahaliea aestuarii]TXS94681.1 VOC family protein [Parahaliea aestuarii]